MASLTQEMQSRHSLFSRSTVKRCRPPLFLQPSILQARIFARPRRAVWTSFHSPVGVALLAATARWVPLARILLTSRYLKNAAMRNRSANPPQKTKNPRSTLLSGRDVERGVPQKGPHLARYLVGFGQHGTGTGLERHSKGKRDAEPVQRPVELAQIDRR